jgi:hypothetical protein
LLARLGILVCFVRFFNKKSKSQSQSALTQRRGIAACEPAVPFRCSLPMEAEIKFDTNVAMGLSGMLAAGGTPRATTEQKYTVREYGM